MQKSLTQNVWVEIGTKSGFVQNKSDFEIIIQTGINAPSNDDKTGLALKKLESMNFIGSKIFAMAPAENCIIEIIEIQKTVKENNLESRIIATEDYVELPENMTGATVIIDGTDGCAVKLVGTCDRANLDGSPIEIDLSEALSNEKKLISIGRFAGVRMEITTDNSVDEVKATLETALTGENNDLKYTAKGTGTAGDNVSIEYADPAVESAELEVVVDGSEITVNLATNDQNGGEIITTADEIKAAIALVPAAVALVTVADKAGNDGSGVVTAMAKTNLSGGVNPVAATKPIMCVIAG